MKFLCRLYPDKLDFGSDYNRRRLKDFARNNPGIRAELVPLLPESRKQRKFYHGAVLPLWAYLDGKDYRNPDVLAEMHEVAKLEFNSKMVVVKGKTYMVGESTRGKLQTTGLLERLIDYLDENYGINTSELLSPKDYKYWEDAIFPTGEHDDYIDYLRSIGKLK